MSKDSTTTLSDSGQATINNLNYSRSSDNEKTQKTLTLPIFKNIRRKRRATKTDRDHLLQIIDDRSIFQLSRDVDLGFLEKRREVLKKKQQLLNRTLRANKLKSAGTKKEIRENEFKNKTDKEFTDSKQVSAEGIGNERLGQKPIQQRHHQQQQQQRQPLEQQQWLQQLQEQQQQQSLKHDQPKDETLNVTVPDANKQQADDENFDRTKNKNLLESETKTTFNFNIYNAEINRNLLRSKPQLLMNESKESVINETQNDTQNNTTIDPTKRNFESHKNNEDSIEDDKENKDLPDKTREFLLNLIRCKSLVSVVFYILILILLLLFSLSLFKFFTSSPNKHGIQEHKLHHIHSGKHTNESRSRAFSKILQDSLSEHDGKLLNNNNNQILSLIYELTNTTGKNSTSDVRQMQPLQQLRPQPQQLLLPIDKSNSNVDIPKNYFSPQGQQYFWHVENEIKRQNIPTVKTSFPENQLTPPTPQTLTTTTAFTTHTPTTITTQGPTTLDPVLLKANTVATTLNITRLPQTLNAGSTDSNAIQRSRTGQEFSVNNPERIPDVTSRSSVIKYTLPAEDRTAKYNSPSLSDVMSLDGANVDIPGELAYSYGGGGYENRGDIHDRNILPEYTPTITDRSESFNGPYKGTLNYYRYSNGIVPSYEDNDSNDNVNNYPAAPTDEQINNKYDDGTDENINLKNLVPLKDNNGDKNDISDAIQESKETGDDQEVPANDNNNIDDIEISDNEKHSHRKRKGRRKHRKSDVHEKLPADILSTLIERIPILSTTQTPSTTTPTTTTPTTTTPTTTTTTTTATTTTTLRTTPTSLIDPEEIAKYNIPNNNPRDPLEKLARREYKQHQFDDDFDDDDSDDDNANNDVGNNEHDGHFREKYKTFIQPDDSEDEYNEGESEIHTQPFEREMKYKNEYIDDDLFHRKTLENNRNFRLATLRTTKRAYADSRPKSPENNLDYRQLKQTSKKQSEKIAGLEHVVKLLQTGSSQRKDKVTNSDDDNSSSNDLMKTEDIGITNERDTSTTTTGKDISLELNDDDLMSMSSKSRSKAPLEQPVSKKTLTENDDLMQEFVEFEKVRQSVQNNNIKLQKREKHKPIPKPTKRRKTEVKTYKLKTCIELKTFNPGELVQIVKGPNKNKIKNKGKINYTVRSCTKKAGKRFLHMKCKDIIYKISTGKLKVKQKDKKDGKRVFAVYGCRNDEVVSPPPKPQSIKQQSPKVERDDDDSSDDSNAEISDSSGSGGEDKDEVDEVEDASNSWTVDQENVNKNHGIDAKKKKETKESKQLGDLMNIVKDLKKEIQQQKKARQSPQRVASKKKNIPHPKHKKQIHDDQNDKDNNEDDSDDGDNSKDYRHNDGDNNRHDIEDNDDGDVDDDDDREEEEHKNEKRKQNEAENDRDDEAQNDDDRDGDDLMENHKQHHTGSRRSRISKTPQSDDNEEDGDDGDDNDESTRKIQTVERHHHSNQNNEDYDEYNDKGRRTKSHRFVGNHHHDHHEENNEVEDEDVDSEDSKEKHINGKRGHIKYTDKDSNDDDSNDGVGSDGDDLDDDERDEEGNHHASKSKQYFRRNTERSSIPYNSHIREFRQNPHHYGNQEEEEEEEDISENEPIRSFDRFEDENENYNNGDVDDIGEHQSEGDQDLSNTIEEGDLMHNGDFMDQRHPEERFLNRESSQPPELTYNGVKYVAKNPGYRERENPDLPGVMNTDEEFPLDSNPTGELPQKTSVPTLDQTLDQTKNIENVVRAILPEVVKSVSNERAFDVLSKRNSIPESLISTSTVPTTTTPTTTTPTTTISTTTITQAPFTKHLHTSPNQKTEDSSMPSSIDMIIRGLKALGLSGNNNKDQQRDKRTSRSNAAATTRPPQTTRPSQTKRPTTVAKPATTTFTTQRWHETSPIPQIINLHDPRQVRILCFGDSLTAGYNQHGKSYFPYCTPLRSILNYHSHLFVFSEAKGITGEMVHKQMTHRLPIILGNATIPYDWVIILGGTNDILHVKNFGDDDDEFLKQLENVWQPRILKDIEKLHEIAYQHGSHTMLLTVPENSIETWREFKPLYKMRQKINDELRDFAYRSKGKTVLCDIAKKIPRHSLSLQQEHLLWDDHLHLTPRGYTKMAGAVSDCLRPYLPNTNR